MNKIYEPIKKKIKEWLNYELNEPKVPYYGNEELFDEFRSNNDRDCVLTNGNLHADTMFSLWTPLKNTILRIHSEEEIAAVGNINSKYAFLPELNKEDNLEKLLPQHLSVTSKLSKLFELGLGIENVFLLPDRNLNCARARRPYCDYMPVFLWESFPEGKFAYAWQNVDEYVAWIRKEKLHVFFDGEIVPDNITDLSRTGEIHKVFPDWNVDAMEKMIDNYISILEKRRNCFTQKELEDAKKGMKIMERKISSFNKKTQCEN